ncbi:hypothetical protein [Pseudonocardia sp. GCM10023141]|uniref:hypothetical protein n=1 Tax=Pseudonocardia sp. GCM10023141 TaxID=3252653 RepID=UPI00361EE26E
MNAPNGTSAGSPSLLLRRDLDAVAAHLDAWILAADEVEVPVLGSPDWIKADRPLRDAAVAVYVLACLAESEPVVIAARLAAEIAAGRAAHLAALRQASHAISAAADWSQHAGQHRSTPSGIDHERKGSA